MCLCIMVVEELDRLGCAASSALRGLGYFFIVHVSASWATLAIVIGIDSPMQHSCVFRSATATTSGLLQRKKYSIAADQAAM